ncbi:MAG: AMP-binding protein, partial [bacterium]|nr:AMP-binding protein [bacterium]
KIRGYRIELGEIETHLLNHPLIKEAVVTIKTRDDGDSFLAAYFISAAVQEKDPEPTGLRDYLIEELPDYMIPSYFVQLDQFPLTPSGKINRNVLPEPQIKGAETYVPPRNEVERTLLEIWARVLGRDVPDTSQPQPPIGINDNFFLNGGDSIKSIRIVSGMRDAGYQIHMRDIFNYPTVSQLSPRVVKLERIARQEPVTGSVKLTPIQQRFFSRSTIGTHHFNRAMMFYSAEGFDEEAITVVFTKIQVHHDALRMTYKYKKSKNKTGKILQTGHGPDYPLSLEVSDLRGLSDEDRAPQFEAAVHRLRTGIDLETGPLMKLGLIHRDDGDRLLIVIHHLVADGVSWRILLEDIDTLMQQYKNHLPLVLPVKSDSFKLWAETLSHYADSPGFLEEKTYWRELESIGAPRIENDSKQEENDVKDTDTVSFRLSKAETDRLLTQVNQAFNTEINDILLTALAAGIKGTWGQHRVLIDVEGHGREEIPGDVDISRTVGRFTSVYPVLLDVSYDHDPARRIKEIKETLRRVPGKGIGYGILKYLTARRHKKGMDFTLHPQVGFNAIRQFDPDVNPVSFELAKESIGNMQSPERPRQHELEVSGILNGNRLAIRIAFNKNQYKTKTIKRLLSHFRSQLSRLIAFCVSKDTKELTPSDLTYNRLSIETVDRLNRRYAIQDLYTLSPMQEGMLFHKLYDDSSASYFEQISYRLQGDLDIALVEKSLNELFKRHSILRTAFVHEGFDRPLQVVLRGRAVDFHYEDISPIHGTGEKEKFIDAFKEKDKLRSFDLDKDTLIRVSVFKSGPDAYDLTWSFHHVLMDGWCIGILNAEFFEVYNSFRENRPFRLPPVQPYVNYIKWLEKQDKEVAGDYWANYLDSYGELTGVPRLNAHARHTPGDHYKNERAQLVLDRETTHRLNECAGRNQVTLNTVIQAIWGVILGKYNRREDILFGVVVSGRPAALEGVESMVGLFINTVPLRIRFEDNPGFNRLLRRVQDGALTGEPHHHYPLADIQTQSILKQNLLDHILVFENYPIETQIRGVGIGSDNNPGNQNEKVVLTNIEVFEQVNYDFSIVIIPGDRLKIKFDFNCNVYHPDLTAKIPGHFNRVIQQIVSGDALRIDRISLLTQEEKHRVLNEFNDTQSLYPDDKPVHQLFMEQAEKTPDHIAVTGETSIAYGALHHSSTQLAHILTQNGLHPDRNPIAGIMLDSSLEMVIGLLGILKAGGAYMPINPDYPRERIDFMLQDSGAKVLITGEEGIKGETGSNNQLAIINYQLSMKETSAFSASSAVKTGLTTGLAYIIYTSGSTGVPKGVLVEHRNLSAYLHAFDCQVGVTAGDVVIRQSSFTF